MYFASHRFSALTRPKAASCDRAVYDELRITAQKFLVRRARPARVVLAPGAPRKARRLTGPLGQISRTEAVEVDFGQSFEEARLIASKIQITPGWRGLTAAPSCDDS